MPTGTQTGAELEAGLTSLVIFLGFAVLRVASVGLTLATSTLVLDADANHAPALRRRFARIRVHLHGSGGRLVGKANVPRRGGALVFAATFALAFGCLVLPVAPCGRAVLEAPLELLVVVIVGLLGDRLLGGSRHASELQAMWARRTRRGPMLSRRSEAPGRAIGPMEISLDVLLPAGRGGPDGRSRPSCWPISRWD